MRVTLAKALILKNRLVQEVSQLTAKITAANAVTYQTPVDKEVQPKFKGNVIELIKARDEATKKLIATKVQIAKANSNEEQQVRIFLLGELKSQIANLKAMPCTASKTFAGYGQTNIVNITFVQIDEDRRDQIVTDMQKQIDAIQEETEKFNWKTEIEVPD